MYIPLPTLRTKLYYNYSVFYMMIAASLVHHKYTVYFSQIYLSLLEMCAKEKRESAESRIWSND